jgi:peptide/nickel transport system permease protein
MTRAASGELGSAMQPTQAAPSPTDPGPARVAHQTAQVGQARLAVGEEWGGGSLLLPEVRPQISTPTPSPSPQRGGESTESAAGPYADLVKTDKHVTQKPAHNTGLAAALRHARYILGENAVTGFAFGLFLLIVLAALIGPYVVPYDPLASDTAAALKGPSAAHWFGTDQLGRDVFSRVIVATRLDFFIAVASVALVFLMGGLAGVAAGFFGGWTDRIVGRIADTIMAFPLFVLAMGIVAALGNTVQNIVLATAIVNFPLYARVARAEANVRREAGFVQAARLSGNGEMRILLGQILPNIMPIMVVQMSLTMGYAILNAAGLSFIGLGVRPPTAEWGIMVAEGAAFMVSGEWWIAFFPGAALMIAVFCFNLLGDGLRDIVDPQRRT